MTWQRQGQACSDSVILLTVLRSIPHSHTHARTHAWGVCGQTSQGAPCAWLFAGVHQTSVRGEKEVETVVCLLCEGSHLPIRWLFYPVVCHVSVVLLHSLHLSSVPPFHHLADAHCHNSPARSSHLLACGDELMVLIDTAVKRVTDADWMLYVLQKNIHAAVNSQKLGLPAH